MSHAVARVLHSSALAVTGLACGLAVALLCGLALAAPLKEAALIPQWEPQAQFAGYYVALAKGFYAAEGVDMRILRGGPGSPPSALLREGRAQFGTFFLPTAIRDRAAGLPLVHLAQFVSHSNQLLIARKADGIASPADLDGRRVSLWGPEFRIAPEAFFKKYAARVTEVPQGYTVDLFLRGGVAACSAMRYNEYHAVVNSGLDPEELTVFAMADHGLDLPEDGLYTLEATWTADPDLCRAVVRATIRGWRYAFDHPDEALSIVMSHVSAAHLPTNRMHQKWMLEHLRQAMAAGGGELGAFARDRYEAAAGLLVEAGLIGAAPAYEAFHAESR
uniref:Thiamine pyrimidine synthase n=1 Tax=Desulfovibrio sp. U5L TaxID=596152 RepID=I2Q4I3_9BACT